MPVADRRNANRRRLAVRMALLAGATVPLVPAAAALAGPPSTDYRLVFADEFNGGVLDTSKWSAASPGWTMPNSASTASASMVSVGGGVLTLSAARNGTTSTFTSGSISSYQKYNYAGGYCEARILLPNTVGSWPAFWGLYTGWPPEADMMEYPLTTNGTSGMQNNQYNTAFHYSTGTGNASGAGTVTRSSDLRGSYHTFGMDWVTNTSVAFYFDGVQVQSFTNSAVSQMVNMYMILDYAVGGWPGTPSLTQWPAGLTDQMKVDYVRVYQKDPGDPGASWTVNGNGSWDTAGNWSLGAVPHYGNQVATFGRAGNAATAAVSIGSWHVIGGLTFAGDSTGTTAYTIGSSANSLQLAGTVTPVINAQASSTANQTISSNLELWNNTQVENDMAGNFILINGLVSGSGSLSVDGVGMTVLSGRGSNSYSGGTFIDSGATGPGVLRATKSGALGTGGVVIGVQGNGTTGRLELAGGITLVNPIGFNGRNNTSVAVENIGGTNSLTGTLTMNVGGSSYIVQSDSDLLNLTGSDAAAGGVAITSAAGGARTLTLQGAGNGAVSGMIQNGAAMLGLLKSGAGTWTLSGNNSYSGGTTVSGGTLVLAQNAWSPVLSGAGGANVTSGQLAFDYTGATTPAAMVVADLRSGKIHSSAADAYHTLGWLDDGVSKVTVEFTLYGDLNLDGVITADDYALMDRGQAEGGSGWVDGDVNNDGVVNSADYLLMDTAYGHQEGVLSPELLAARQAEFGAAYVNQLEAAVPEPSALAGGLLAGAALVARRRRC